MVQKAESSKEKSLKPAQVCASALAAVTAAFLGSTLGVAGTIAGAGVASLVTTIGSEVYLRSLRRTRDAARKTRMILAGPDTRLRQETRLLEPPPPPPNPLVRPEAARPDDDTVHLPRPDQGEASSEEPTAFLSPSTGDPTTLLSPSGAKQPKKPWWASRWAVAAGLSVVAFAVGILAITGFEALTGHAVSGGTGTTVGRIVQGPPPSAPATAPSSPATVTREPAGSSPPPTTTTTTETSTTTTVAPASSPSPASTTSAPSSSPVSAPSSAPPSSG